MKSTRRREWKYDIELGRRIDMYRLLNYFFLQLDGIFKYIQLSAESSKQIYYGVMKSIIRFNIKV